MMVLIRVLGVVALAALLLGGNCSRERVESMNAMNEGVVYAQKKHYLEAVEKLQQATALDGTNDQAFYNLAVVNVEMKNYQSAKESLERAISIRGDVAGYHEKLGSVFMELEAWNDAKAAFERAIEIDPQLFKAYYKSGQVLERLDDLQNALYRYTDAIKKGPRFLPAYASLGRLYADLGYPDQAVQVLTSALKAAQVGTDEEANVHHLLGTVYEQRGQHQQAVEEFGRALQISPNMRDTLFAIGWTHWQLGNRDEARRYLDKFLKAAGDDTPDSYLKAAKDRLAELDEAS